MTAFRWITLFLIGLAGCEPAAEVRQYVAPAEYERMLTSDLIRDRFDSVPFRWSVPSQWVKARNDQFSKFAWTTGANSETRITITSLPSTAGIAPQVTRWAGQIGIEASNPATLMNSVEPLEMGGLTGQWVELAGPGETILGMLLAHRDKIWVVKLRGTAAQAAAAKKSLRSFCQSWST